MTGIDGDGWGWNRNSCERMGINVHRRAAVYRGCSGRRAATSGCGCGVHVLAATTADERRRPPSANDHDNE